MIRNICRFITTMLLICFSAAGWPQWTVGSRGFGGGGANQYLRPTADSDSSSAIISVCSGSGVHAASSSMSSVYSGKSGIGPVTSAFGYLQGSGNTFEQRIFSSWQSASASYSNLALSVNWSCAAGNIDGVCTLGYSSNSGASWTTISSTAGSFSQQTTSVTITGTLVANLEVAACVINTTDTSAQANIYDIWTSGIF